ncbi:MAG: hypothetical protein ACXWDO_09590, partial [Bacteroidia bacterium]
GDRLVMAEGAVWAQSEVARAAAIYTTAHSKQNLITGIKQIMFPYKISEAAVNGMAHLKNYEC